MSAFLLSPLFSLSSIYMLFLSDAQRETIPALRQAETREKKNYRSPEKKRTGEKRAEGGRRNCRQRLREGAFLFRCSCTSCSRCEHSVSRHPRTPWSNTLRKPLLRLVLFLPVLLFFNSFSDSFELFKSSQPAFHTCDEMFRGRNHTCATQHTRMWIFIENYKAQRREPSEH